MACHLRKTPDPSNSLSVIGFFREVLVSCVISVWKPVLEVAINRGSRFTRLGTGLAVQHHYRYRLAELQQAGWHSSGSHLPFLYSEPQEAG